MNERVLLAIMGTLESYTEPPGIDWPEEEKKEVTFTSWALSEILLLVWDHPWTLASETIEKFATKMETYAMASISDAQNRIFNIAATTAWDLLEEVRPLEF